MDLTAKFPFFKENERKIAISFFVGLAILLGSFVRIFFISHTDYPINDGGLFYRITEEIIHNGFKLPMYSGYNQANIPVAYPPFGFYLAAIIKVFFGIPLMALFKWLPTIINILTIPAFYLLAKEILNDDFGAAFSVLLFSLLPKAYDGLLWAGG